MWFSWNPRHKTDAVDKFFRGAEPFKGTVAVEVNWQDNPWFPDVLRTDMEQDYEADPEMAHHVWGGGYEVVTEGSYYGKDIADAARQGRICFVPHDRASAVYASWDLGIGDSTAIWVFQRVGLEWHFLDCYENVGKSLDHYIDWLGGHPYKIGLHVLPHDAEARELQTGKSRQQFFIDRGLSTMVVPRHEIGDRIHAVRMMLPYCYFDKNHCEDGMDALRLYRSEFSEKNQTYADRPRHDASSHFADSFGYAAMGAPDSAREAAWKKPIIRNLHLVS
jgi:phage terminase large subunit